jgi:CRP-like cAMP-binding protein
MVDMDFTKPQPPPESAAAPSAPFKPASSQFYNAAVAAALFRSAGKEERFAAGQTLFVEDEKVTKGGLFSSKGATRMFFLAEGEVALTMGGRALDSMKAGEIVGEMAVISERPRSATATAKSDTVAYSLNATELQGALAKNPEFALMLMSVMFDRLRFLAARLATRKASGAPGVRESQVFDPKLHEQLEGALARSSIVRHAAGAAIMRQGQSGSFMYVVKTGRVAITIADKVVEVVTPGGTFGEMALVDQSPRTANATAEVYSELLAIDRPSVIEAVKQQPAFAMAMLRAVADRLRYMNSQLA